MGILAKEIEHKLTQILLDCRRQVLSNRNGKDEDWIYGELAESIDNLRGAWIEQNKETQRQYSTKVIALLIQYQLKYL